MNRFVVKLFIFALAFSLLACAKVKDTKNSGLAESQQDSLYHRIGGLPVLTKIVDEFIDEVATSPKTKRSFDGIKLKTLKESVVAHLCELTDGPCKYEGETMSNSHRDSKITEAEFDAFVGIFRETLNKYVGTREKNELLKILAPMKRDIVANS